MKQFIFIHIILIALCSCGQNATKTDFEYPLQVGDITFDPEVDDPSFKLCDEERVLQYYNFGKGLQYKGEKPAINEYFLKSVPISGASDDTGYLTLRFVVNCGGKTGRFRVLGIDQGYSEREFSADLTSKLLKATRQLDGWVVGEYDGRVFDYYQYLTFKIERGKLIEVLP
ncbi:MAG: hypothetical protein KDC99_07200 [Cyclobacteriaceae bacterium]|nr:hypothetical protein [Cyclobacteriaceae bacterium]